MDNFIIGTGYHHKDNNSFLFSKIWYENLIKSVGQNKKIVCVSTSEESPYLSSMPNCETLNCKNLGHVNDREDNDITIRGWASALITLCLVAYNNRSDLVYLEQDCLAFGDWVSRAYNDLGDSGMVFGHKHTSAPFMPCSQSLIVIKSWFLLIFVREYLNFNKTDTGMLPEIKFCEIERMNNTKVKRLSFGVDRCRPIPWNDKTWYAQQWTEQELEEARNKKLI